MSTVFDSQYFSPEFKAWLTTAPLDDVYQAVSDHYKEEYGVRPRWMAYDTREEYAAWFVSESERVVQQANDSREQMEWEANPLNHPLEVVEPEPLPYEEYDR